MKRHVRGRTGRAYQWLCLLLMLLACVRAQAQSSATASRYLVSVKHITLEQGSSSRQILTVGQDKQGFIWAGTTDNVYRFDGQRFEPLPPITMPTDQQPYSPGFFNVIHTDRQGALWLAGTVVGEKRQQVIIKPGQTQGQLIDQAFGHPDPFLTDVIYDFAPSRSNSFQYVRTQSGTIWKHLGQGRFRKLFQHWGLTKTMTLMSYETDQQTLLVSYHTSQTTQSSALIELDSTGRILQRHDLPSWLRPIGKGADGSLYLHRVLLDDEVKPVPLLYQLSPSGKLTELAFPFNQHNKATRFMYYDAFHDLFWLTGDHLLMAWHPRKGIVFDLSKTDFPMASIEKLHQILVDRTGAVWVTSTNGVLVLTLEPNRFQRYLYVPNTQIDKEHYAIRGIRQLGNQLWVNSRESHLVDLKTGNSRTFLTQLGTPPPYAFYLCPVVQDATGAVWTASSVLLRVDLRLRQSANFLLTANNECVSAWFDDRQTIWFGQQHGLSVFDTRQFHHYPFTRYNQFSELAESRVNGFFPDRRSGNVWIAASSGLYLLDTLRGITARYHQGGKASTRNAGDAVFRPYLPFDHITFIHPDADQAEVYWLATRGGGLIRWNRRAGTYQQFTQKQGLSDNTLYAIYEDKHNRLWLPSNYGLMSFHRKSHQIQIYHTKDGIADEEFNLIAHHQGPDGRLFLGGLNGITAFYPDQIQAEKPTLSPVLVTQYQKLNTETGKLENHLADFQQAGKLHLTASDRLFTLGFTLLDYRNLGQTRLWYRITNWQENWVVQDRLALSINGLPAGDYTVQVRAQGPNGDWESPVLSLPLTVDKPIYLRGWFLLLALLVVGGGGVAVFRWRNRQLVRDKIRLEAEVARRTAQIEKDKAIIEQQAADLQVNATLKSRFFANVSHELRTPLTLLLGPLQYLTRRITDASARQLLSAMERNTHQLLTLVNDLLDLTRLDVHQLKIIEQPIDLAQLIQQTVGNFMAQAQYIGVYLHVSGLDKPLWMPLDTQKLETVLRNLIANALNYTATSGSVHIALTQANDQAQISVTDTGSGIHPNDLPHIFERYFQSNQTDKPLRGGTGIGLALCQEYSMLWGGEISVSSQFGKGSTFTVSYPIRPVQQSIPHPVDQPAAPLPIAEASLMSLPALSLTSEQQDIADLPVGGITILVVEDNADMLLYIQTVLAPYYELLIARNGRQALDLLNQLAAEQLPNLIISDIMMPEVDGLALVQALRQRPALRHIPLVLLTARVDLETRLQALRLGVADYLTKPFYEAELLVRIQNLLNRVEEQTAWQQKAPDEQEKLLTTLSDADWLQFAQQTVRQNLTNSALTINLLAELTHVSVRQLYRRTKELTGLSPNQFIQEVRLQIAHELLTSQPQTMVKSIGYQVGYQKTSYFIQLYRERFGINPGEQLRQIEPELSQVS